MKCKLFFFNFSPSLARLVLSRILTAGHTNVRLAATRYLTEFKSHDNVLWVIDLLFFQLFDVSAEIRSCALNILVEYCNYEQVVEYIIKKFPYLENINVELSELFLK